MNAVIPREFEVFARQQIEAGTFATEQEAVDAAVRGDMQAFEALRAALDDAVAGADRDGWIGGETFMAELLAETEARVARRE